MNQERQKTDAIADAVEIPEGATHYLEHSNRYGRVNKKGFIELWHNSRNRFEEVPLRINETVLKPR